MRNRVPQRFVGRYGLGPFLLESELELTAPGADAGTQSGRPVQLRLGVTGAVPAKARQVTPYVSAWPGGCLLALEGTGRFLVRDGCELVLELDPRAAAADVQSYVLGWCFGALCLQNGMLPLHACAVDFGGGTAAFLGNSGAGKSTLAASLSRRGYTVVADDICLLAPVADGKLQVIAYAGSIKLWQTSLDFLGEQAVEEQRTFAGDDKFRVALKPPAEPVQAAALTRLVMLERGDDTLKAPELLQLTPAVALAAMLDNIYLGYCVEAMELRAALFAQCALALGVAQSCRLRVPWGFQHVPATLEFLQQRVLRPGDL